MKVKPKIYNIQMKIQKFYLHLTKEKHPHILSFRLIMKYIKIDLDIKLAIKMYSSLV